MYSARCRKLFFTAMFLAIIPVMTNLFITGVQAKWVIGEAENDIYPARPGYIPVIDGVEEDAWASTSKLYDDIITPRLAFRMKYNLTTAYCVIVVKTDTHTPNETVSLLLSNNGTKLTDAQYFTDAKYVCINNATEDRQWVSGHDYIVDTDQNITSKVSFYKPSERNWTVYEFGFCFKNTDPKKDTVWTTGNKYAAKIRVGDDNTPDDYVDSDIFAIEMGVFTNTTDTSLTDLPLDINVITTIIFSVTVGLYAILGVYVFISRKKVVGLAGRTPEMSERKTKSSEREFDDTTEQSEEEVLGDEEEGDGEQDDKEAEDVGEED